MVVEGETGYLVLVDDDAAMAHRVTEILFWRINVGQMLGIG